MTRKSSVFLVLTTLDRQHTLKEAPHLLHELYPVSLDVQSSGSNLHGIFLQYVID
jgi:hypothetical protein